MILGCYNAAYHANGIKRIWIHDHGSPGHAHGKGNVRAIAIAPVITGSYMFAELFGSIVYGSLADAGQMLSDFVSIF